MATTINDVAKKAGVSPKTVSRMLGGYRGIRPDTRARIQQVIEELEFFPSAAARSLRGQKSGLVGLIADNLTTTPYSVEIIKGIRDVCEAEDKHLLIGETADSPRALEGLVDDFRQFKVEAIIKATMFHKEISITQSFTRCPLILVNCFDAEARYPAFVPDDELGSYELTKHLIALGHANIAYLTLPADMVATGLRVKGYKRAMKEARLPVTPEWVRLGISEESNDEFENLKNVLYELLATSPKPTAILCGNDKMAMRTIMHLQELNVRAPSDISVAGFDDLALIAENLIPQLTTVKLPYYEMGVAAAQLAIELSEKEEIEHTSNPANLNKVKCDVRPRHSAVPFTHS